MKIKYKLFGIIFLFLSFYSCKLPLLNNSSNNRTKNDTEFKGVALILLSISNAEGQYSISISNSRIIETTKKIDDKQSDIWHENDFVCFILDKHNIIMDTLLIFQPLHPRFEYPEDGDTIGSRVIEQKNIDLLLRFSYLSTMKYLRIEKIEENNELRLLDILEIPLIR